MTDKWRTVALGQGGVISLAQLIEGGLSKGQITTLVAQGHLGRVWRGAYTLPDAAGWETDVWVALMSSGPGGFLCRRSAGTLWKLDGVEPGHIDVAVGPGHRSRRPSTTRLSTVTGTDVVTEDGKPTTTIDRTLLDLGSVVDADIVERAMECALRREAVSVGTLYRQAAGRRTPGSSVLLEVLRRRPPGAPPTESDAETLFLQLARRMGLPEPVRQEPVSTRGKKYRLDFAWPHLRLAVEIDGASVHGPDQLTSDHRRQNAILLDGWLLLRFTWAMVVNSPELVAWELKRAWDARSITVA